MTVLGVDNIFLPVADLDRAVEFYRDVLGLPLTRRFDAIGTALFAIGPETPGLGVGVSAQSPGPSNKVWLEVSDARETARELVAAGVTALAPPFEIPTGWVVEVRDPWGNIIGFTDYSNRPDLGRQSRGA